MSEETNTLENTQPETKGENAQGTQPESGKMFTQEEVNSFIQSRLGRMKAQAEKEVKASLDQREQELQAREMKLLVKEKLSERGMSAELASVITCTDEKDLEQKLDILAQYSGKNTVQNNAPEPVQGGFRVIGAQYSENPKGHDPIRAAMGLDKE